MGRSQWKPIFFKKHRNNHTLSRKNTIAASHVKLTMDIHNGKQSTKILIVRNMRGFKAGSFLPTRATYVFKKRKNTLNKWLEK